MSRARNRTQTLGQLLKQWREESNLSQRALARRLGVSASIISYIEKGLRRPSLSLLTRIADLIGIEKRRAFVLAWPEARSIVDGVAANQASDAWPRFAGNRTLLVRHRVTKRELIVLKQFSQLGAVANPRYFLFVLNSIRQALAEE